MQGETNKSNYNGPWDCTKKVIRQGGPQALFRGLLPTVLRDTPSFAAYFWVYEYIKRNFFRSPDPDVTSDLGVMVAGARPFYAAHSVFRLLASLLSSFAMFDLRQGSAAGVAAWALCYPVDLVKSRMQMDSVVSPKYSGMVDCAKKSFEEGGVRLFFKGIMPTIARAIVVNGPIFYVYEFSLAALDKINPEEDDDEDDEEDEEETIQGHSESK